MCLVIIMPGINFKHNGAKITAFTVVINVRVLQKSIAYFILKYNIAEQFSREDFVS